MCSALTAYFLAQAERAQLAERAEKLTEEIAGIQKDLDTQLAQQRKDNDDKRQRRCSLRAVGLLCWMKASPGPQESCTVLV